MPDEENSIFIIIKLSLINWTDVLCLESLASWDRQQADHDPALDKAIYFHWHLFLANLVIVILNWDDQNLS